MANAATSQGQLQRAGTTRLVSDKRGRKREAHDPNWVMRQKKMHRKMKAGGPGSGPQQRSDRDALLVKGRSVLDKLGKKQEGGPGSGPQMRHVADRFLKKELKKRKMKDAPDVEHHGQREAKRRRVYESSFGSPFTEKGQPDKQKQPGGGVAKGRVYLVTIIEEGLGNSKDKNYYSAEALQTGIQPFNGSKAYSDHPDAISEKTLPERSMKDLVGWYSDCFTDKNPQTGKVRLRGKLHFFPDAKWLTDKIDTILTDPTAQKLFGISINAIGKTRPATMQGEEVNYVEEFQRVDSADVVTEPAARGGFDKMLESKRGNRSHDHRSKVSRSVNRNSRRTREAATLSAESTKEIADSLVSAYNSDNPDELKQAAFEAAKVLHAASSISGKGPGQVNEEQYSNINPSGGSDSEETEENEMAIRTKASRRTKASASPFAGFKKGKRRMQAAAGTGEDNEDVGEPEPSDIPDELEEADVEDEEGRGELGDQSEFGGGSKYRKVKTSMNNGGRVRPRVAASEEAIEDEGLEGMEDEGMEGMEDEDEDEMGGGMPPGAGAAAGGGNAPGAGGGGMAAPAGGGAPGSSRSIASSEAGDDDDDDDDDDDLDDMDEAIESLEDEDEGGGDMRPGVVAESRGRRRGMRRSHEADASLSGGLGKAGRKSLPVGGDTGEGSGYDQEDGTWGKEDSSTSGVGKSYKIKTSRFSKNRKARRVAQEANRRLDILANEVKRLRESNRAKDRKIVRYSGKMRLLESSRTAVKLLREAVKEEILPSGYARTLYRPLLGMNRDDQIEFIKDEARRFEAVQEGTMSRLTESVEGNGARGSFVSRGSADSENSELIEGLAGDGVPMKEDE